MRSRGGFATAVGIMAAILAFVSLPAGAATQPGVSITGEVVFTTQDQKIIKEYYQGGQGKLPPGLAKRAKLPPGLRKHIERDGTLPPGLQKKIQPLPVELEQRLTPLPSGVTRASIGVDVIIVDKTTKKILDVMRDVIQLGKDIAK